MSNKQQTKQVKHTEGEWKVDPDFSNNSKTVVVSQRHTICRMHYYKDLNIQESEANAKLIAAAPELLGFAQSFVSQYGGECTGLLREFQLAAEQAIKKATE